ncbi:MAG TPA: heavy metal translocating P-type ATPase [Candidatus Acidoferrales bacterium]|nr:heavy metal translocating P-type ATPase [Candidatus Acidoferrales bacterium]
MTAGGALRIVGAVALSNGLWGATAAVALLPTTFSVARNLMRRRAGVDIVAVLALAGTLAVGEYLAGAVIALMLATGRELEARASARARRELSALLSRAPAVVHRIEGDTLMTQPIDAVRSGDVLIVAPGEVVPVDGLLASDNAVFDESALTGESALVERVTGDPVRSGGVNAGGAFRLRSTATADASTYAGIVRLVRQAQESRAPLVRVADRFALWFVPLTIAIAGLSGILARDPVRAVAVLVVATPCPLILAAPIALVGGMSRAARRGIVVKGGAALETLGRADVLLFDKTGTLTEGRARVADIETDGSISADEVLRLGASLDQASTHALARATVQAARARGLRLVLPDDVHEDPGKGVRGSVADRRVMIGRASYVADGGAVPPWAARVRRRTAYQGLANVFVGVDGILVGALVLEDPIRPDSGRAVARLRTSGMRRMVMVTGDHPDVAQAIASAIGVDAVYAERSPAEKVEVVREERERGIVVMVGDGINDAPALAAADVGVAMGVRGATASSEAADVVLMVDRIDRLAEAVLIARRSHHIAVQSIAVGMGLSLVAMGIAAAGALVPVVGAVVQEAIDVAVILNALRARGGPEPARASETALSAGRQVLLEHASMERETAKLRSLADEIGRLPRATARSRLHEVKRFLNDQLLPHEREEEQHLYPVVARYIGGPESVAVARREHAEVAHLSRVLSGMIDTLDPEGPDEEDLIGLRRALYSLSAVLSLHRSGEEELLSAVVGEQDRAPIHRAG